MTQTWSNIAFVHVEQNQFCILFKKNAAYNHYMHTLLFEITESSESILKMHLIKYIPKQSVVSKTD